MNCNEFRDSIAERVDGDLSAARTQEFDAHEHACSACRATAAEWRQLADTLRAAWPSVDPPPHRVLLPTQTSGSWLDVTGRWCSYASMALVAASLLLLVLLRPSIHLDRNQLALSFGSGEANTKSVSAPGPSQEAVQTWARAAVHEAVLQQVAEFQQASQSAPDRGEAQRLNQLVVRLKMMEETQASLWQRTEEQRVYLQSLWLNAPAQGNSPSERPNGR
jgi:anti-sigma factor RsiW